MDFSEGHIKLEIAFREGLFALAVDIKRLGGSAFFYLVLITVIVVTARGFGTIFHCIVYCCAKSGGEAFQILAIEEYLMLFKFRR